MNKPMTLRELMNSLSPMNGQNRPRWKEVEKKEKPLASYNDGKLRMAVYPSGYISARSGKHHTVFRIEDCRAYDYRFCKRFPKGQDDTPHHLEAGYFLDMRWEIRALMEAEDRLERKNNHYEFDHAARF